MRFLLLLLALTFLASLAGACESYDDCMETADKFQSMWSDDFQKYSAFKQQWFAMEKSFRDKAIAFTLAEIKEELVLARTGGWEISKGSDDPCKPPCYYLGMSNPPACVCPEEK